MKKMLEFIREWFGCLYLVKNACMPLLSEVVLCLGLKFLFKSSIYFFSASCFSPMHSYLFSVSFFSFSSVFQNALCSKSLAQEKMILQLKAENKEQYDDDLSQETIDFKRINEEKSLIAYYCHKWAFGY